MTETPGDQLGRARRALARELAERGSIRTPQWRRVFERTPRHVFVPRFYVRQDQEDGPTLWRELDEQSGQPWAEAVYANATHVITLDPATKQPAAGGWHGIPTSSSTLPGVMATMLEQLDVRDGHRVLEIGTGTGYTCALLCERLGSGHVTSVDIDLGLVELAAQRLDVAGYEATVRAVDGAHGYPAGAPYDRIIATCSVPRVPDAWLAQTRPGGVILTDVRGPVGGALVRLTVAADGTARGTFPRDGAYFMPLRHAIRYDHQDARPATSVATQDLTEVDPALLVRDFGFAWTAQLHLPDVRTMHMVDDDGGGYVELLAEDGSWARVPLEAAAGTRRIARQGGPGRLWDAVERAYRWWELHDRPRWDQFGLSITAEGQHVWFNSPGGDSWEL